LDPCSPSEGDASGYGLGWGIGNIEGHREINHGGGHATGFSSFLGLYRRTGCGGGVLNRGGANPGHIARRVAGIYVPELAPRAAQAIEDKDQATTALLRRCIEGMAGATFAHGSLILSLTLTLDSTIAGLQVNDEE
jgi:hypothetical protein